MQKQMQPQEQTGDTVTIDAPVATPEPPAQPAPAPASENSKLFSAEDIEAARRQEKEKLYPKLTKMEEQLALFQQEREEAQRLAAEQAETEAKARREAEEAELSAKDLLTKKEDEWNQRLNTAQQEWEEKFNALQAESEAKAELLERERRFQELESYKTRRLQEEADNIAPQLLNFIKGNSEEEIDAAISDAVASTSAIMEEVQASLPQRPRTIPATGGAPSGPLENATEQQTFTAAQIAAMSDAEYAQHRVSLLAAASRRS
jgi:hypothetical protein